MNVTVIEFTSISFDIFFRQMLSPLKYIVIFTLLFTIIFKLNSQFTVLVYRARFHYIQLRIT